MDVVFSVHPVAPYFKGVSLHSDAWVDRVRRELVSCISPPDYWKIVLLIDGYLVAQDTSKPYVEKLTTVGKKPLNASSLERVYENILMRANALKFEPVPHKAGMMMPLPPILEKGKAVVKDKLYTFGGFWEDFGSLYRKAVIYDISKSYVEPIKEFDLPNDFPVGTQASTTDGRYIYIAGGQPNPGCSVGSAVAYRFDTETEAFLRLPDLPFHPNSGMLAYLSGSRTLHFTGGSINRSVSLFDYAPHVILNLPESTAFYDLWAAGKTSWKWKQGPPLLDTPRLHHISVVLKDSAGKEALYVMAGVKNDATISADPKDLEISPLGCVTWLGEPDIFTVFKYTPEKREKWLRMPDLPISLSHADPSVVPVLGGMGILIFGGETTLLGPKRKVRKSERKVSNEKMSVIRHIILYVPALDISRVVGYLPKWFRGEGVKALMAIRERAPLPSGGTDNGGILLFGGEMGKNGEPYPGLCVSHIVFGVIDVWYNV